MSGYNHLTAEERDRLGGLMADGLSLRSIVRALGRAVSTISRELRRNALDSGAYRPHVADGAYMLRRQRAAALETDARLAACVTDRLTEGSLSLIALQSSAGQRDARAGRRTSAARDRARPAGGLRGDDLRLDLSTARILSRSGVSQHNLHNPAAREGRGETRLWAGHDVLGADFMASGDDRKHWRTFDFSSARSNATDVEVFRLATHKTIYYQYPTSFSPNPRSHEVRRILSPRD